MAESPERVMAAAKLEAMGDDLRSLVHTRQMLRPVVRQGLVDRLIAILLRGGSALLVGEPGTGKTELARSLVVAPWPSADPNQLKLIEDHPGINAPRIVATGVARFLEGVFYVGNLENKLIALFDEIRKEKAILLIDNIDACIGAGSSSHDPDADVANALVPQLEQGRGVRVIGTTTSAGLARMRAVNPRLVRRFDIVDVPAPTDAEAREMVACHVEEWAKHGVKVKADAVDAGLELVRRRLPGEVAVAGFLRLTRRAAEKRDTVGASELRRALADELGVKPAFVGAREAPRFDELREELATRVFGQMPAVDEVADALLRFAVGLTEPGRPIATFLAAGPSGVGKTQLALATAEALTGNESGAARFDMSEHTDWLAATRLLEDNEHSLVGRLAGAQAGVLLLDEIEKAHPLVVRLLLQALGESRLTSEGGKTVRLDNWLVFLTSNLGSHRFGPVRDEPAAREELERGVLGDCADFFPPEFMARLTRVLLFNPLTEATSEKIARRELAALDGFAGLQERGLTLTFSVDLPARIAHLGTTARNGARGVQRVVRSAIVSPLARWLAENPEVRDGMVRVSPRGTGSRIDAMCLEFVDLARAEAGFWVN